MSKIVTVALPKDLPENWNDTQFVSPGGTEVGLSEKHGYNYLMKQVNNAQRAIEEVDEAVGGLVGVNLLINPYFLNPVDRNNGHIVPKGTLGYSDKECTQIVGTVQEPYRKAYYVNTSYGYVVGSDGVSFYVKHADMVRGYVGSGYYIERWRSNNVNNCCFVEPAGLRLNLFGGSRFYQTVNLSAGTYTFSVLADVATGSNFFIEIPVGVTTKIKNGVTSTTFTLTESRELNTYISTYDSGAALIKAVKLEVGTRQTLAHEDELGNWILTDVTNYALERAKCFQYGAVTAVTTNEAINAVVTGWIDGMSDHQTANFVLSVEQLGLILAGGAWFVTVNKVSDVYATVTATLYDVSGMLIKVCSMNNGVLTGWAMVTPTPVVNATLE